MSDLTPSQVKSESMQWKTLLRALVSLALLIVVFQFVDVGALLARIAGLDPIWLGIALLATLPQYFLSAARWRLTAERLGAFLPFGVALSEYYLAVLTNQILPGGVLGDAARAVRHGRSLSTQEAAANYGPAIRAVIFERASGQLVLFLFMIGGFFFWPTASQGDAPLFEIGGIALLIVLIVGLALFFLIKGPLAKSRIGTGAGGFLAEARHALLARDVVFQQALYSLSVLATYLFCFYCAGRAIGIAMSFAEVVALVPAILFSMTIPITIAGWGIREASAAAIWGLANLTPADGVAISVTYGIIVLLSALPGVFFVIPRSGKGNVGDQR
ncbi:MAG: lysylphosphatidylglycerol synthase transmembrane domain-containing protein [Micropepsaceae bacterium]